MTNPLMETSQARRDEWARVNSLLPWDVAPEWAQFAFVHRAVWFWLEKPPASNVVRDIFSVEGKCKAIRPSPRILTTEHLFRRPGPPRIQSGITRLLMCDVPARLAGKAGLKEDPEKAALKAYAKVIAKGRARFGDRFDDILREVFDEA